jgi:hypothetical protein
MIRRLLLCVALLTVALPALADTASGIAALERGDYAAALALLKPEAEKGDPAAQAKYGIMLAQGFGVARDPAAAVAWFRKSAAQNDPEGQYNLGVAYEVGDAGGVNHAAAAQWYRKAAEQGYVHAQYNLSDMLVKGDGVAKQPVEGAEWTHKAAEQKMADAAWLYGLYCATGTGVDQSMLAARYWLVEANTLGQPKAAADLERLEAAMRKLEVQGAPRTEGGDGSTKERAIFLPDTKTESEGVKAEHLVTRSYFPGWTWRAQSLLNTPDGMLLDVIDMARADGTTKTIYFDIRNWFGKME